MNEFPKLLYRDGDQIEWEGKRFDTLTVADQDEETAALKDGWKLAAKAFSPDPVKTASKRKADKA